MVSTIDAAPRCLFPAFERHGAVMVEAAVALREMVAGSDQLELASKISSILSMKPMALPENASGLAHDIYHAVRPGEHPSLITSMDDSVDKCTATAKGIMLFEMTN